MDLDIQFMRQAIRLAEQAAALGEVPVAALVVKKEISAEGNIEARVIASAHNRRELDGDPTAHAEILAIRQAAQEIGDWRLEGCTIYVTLEPCPMCAGAMWLARIDRCVYGCIEPRAGFLGTIGDITALSELNHHFEIRAGVLAEECSSLLRNFFRKVRKENQKKKKSNPQGKFQRSKERRLANLSTQNLSGQKMTGSAKEHEIHPKVG
jgi:tRNA(adenine34) deaminase